MEPFFTSNQCADFAKAPKSKPYKSGSHSYKLLELASLGRWMSNLYAQGGQFTNLARATSGDRRLREVRAYLASQEIGIEEEWVNDDGVRYKRWKVKPSELHKLQWML